MMTNHGLLGERGLGDADAETLQPAVQLSVLILSLNLAHDWQTSYHFSMIISSSYLVLAGRIWRPLVPGVPGVPATHGAKQGQGVAVLQTGGNARTLKHQFRFAS